MTDVSKDVDSLEDGELLLLKAGLYTSACDSAQSLAVCRSEACSCSLVAGGQSGRVAVDMAAGLLILLCSTLSAVHVAVSRV